MNYRNHFLFTFSMLFFILLFATACNNTEKKVNNRKQTLFTQHFQTGTVVPHVDCLSDTSESYALYLPSDYNVSQKFPVVFFFDAHARGAMVVKKYKGVAENFGFILAASNNSKNGQSSEMMNRVLFNFIQDVEQRFSIDPLRIYTAGFSGGARVAAGIGLYNKSISGTIGLEAGFPPVQQIPDNHLVWVGIVGNTDFNYMEMKELENRLNSISMQNLLLVFPGKHALPPARIFKKAYEFLMFDAMRKKIIPFNQGLIDTVKNQYNQIRLKAQKSNHCMPLLEADKDLVKNLEGLTDVSAYQKEIQSLLSNPTCQLRIKEFNAIIETEAYYQKKFSRSMTTEGAGWWKHQIQEIYRKMNVTRDKRVQLMYQRLLNYLSLSSYLYANRSIQNKQVGATSKFLMIYELVDPDNPEVYFMKAEYFAMQGETNKSLDALRESLDHGFKDEERIKNNTYFKNLKTSAQFVQILEKIKKPSNAE